MVILVSDTSVLIDLERGALLPSAFGCGLQLVVPDLLYEDELEAFNGPYLRSLGLGVLGLSSTELSAVQDVRSRRSALSLSDAFAMILATRDQHALLTGDACLRRECVAQGVQVYGLLWLLDQMEQRGVSVVVLRDGLQILADDVRCRLPRDEVRLRLHRWSPV
jgi:predicted nucleic acid-binding protein